MFSKIRRLSSSKGLSISTFTRNVLLPSQSQILQHTHIPFCSHAIKQMGEPLIGIDVSVLVPLIASIFKHLVKHHALPLTPPSSMIRKKERKKEIKNKTIKIFSSSQVEATLKSNMHAPSQPKAPLHTDHHAQPT